jgi:tetratricopeptide (TPR) repeat protein
VVKQVTTIEDTVDMGSFTPTGVLVNGKKIPLAKEPDGNYLFTVSVHHPGSTLQAHSELSFQILGDVPAISPWDVDEPAIDADESKGILDQQRALCYLAQGLSNEARVWFRAALRKDHGNNIARAHLVEAYYTVKDYSAVVSLYSDAGITADTDSQTIVRIAESFLKTGNTPKAVSILQDAVKSRPQDGSLYLSLSDCYQQMGDSQKEQEMLRKGQALLKAEPAVLPAN